MGVGRFEGTLVTIADEALAKKRLHAAAGEALFQPGYMRSSFRSRDGGTQG
jgi:hypothetical protein